MRIAVTGARGQLGRSLQQILGHERVMPLTLPEWDVADPAICDRLADLKPEVVLHAAAMTNVDGCELNPEDAYRVNALGTRNVALGAREAGAALLYVSTDYVFDGQADTPYWEFDTPRPLSVYGKSKFAGECFVRHLLNRYYIVRTAWVYGPGGTNFVEKVLRLASERPSLSMVVTEFGSPTYTVHLAEAIARLIRTQLYGTYHLTNTGLCSRYEFARAILNLAGSPDYPLQASTSYPRPAPVPARAELRNFCAAEIGITLPPWEEGLEAYFQARGR